MIMKLKRNIAVGESGFLFDLTGGESYSLNQQGLEIINMLKEKRLMMRLLSMIRYLR